ncbi:hypothetical protein CKA32_003252 [Geitlerinema sp. FC II]|nr:hypothetical protein CKA32_003252 [Geitlerinema sp. FC II]
MRPLYFLAGFGDRYRRHRRLEWRSLLAIAERERVWFLTLLLLKSH